MTVSKDNTRVYVTLPRALVKLLEHDDPSVNLSLKCRFLIRKGLKCEAEHKL